MRPHRAAPRAVVCVAILGAGILATATPGAASGGDSVTIDTHPHLTIRTAQSLAIAATAAGGCRVGKPLVRTVTLTLTGPTGPDPTTQTLKSVREPCRRDASLNTTIDSPSRNGSYTVTLQNGSSSRTTTADLDVLIPPAKARGFDVKTQGTIATFTWTTNPEPDVTAYQVMTGSGTVETTADAGDACNDSGCSTKLDLGPRAAGTTRKFEVRAVRCGRSCGGDNDITGADSAPARASFAGGATSPPQPPPASPPSPPSPPAPPAPPGAGGGGGGGGAASNGGGVSLPPAPAGSFGTGGHGGGKGGGTGGAQPGGTATPGVIITPTPTVTTSPAAASPRDNAQGVNAAPIWRWVAAAAVLLLIVVHLRTWARRTGPS